jgi:outer membrane protein
MVRRALAVVFVGLCSAVERSAVAQSVTESAAVSTAAARKTRTTDTLRLDLAGSIALALERATGVQLGRQDVRLSGAALLEAYGRYLPDLRAGASLFGQQGTLLLSSTALRASDASLYGSAYGLSSSINIFNGLRDREHLHAAMLEQHAAESSLQRAREQVAFDVTQAFYQVVLDRRLTAVARATLELSQARETQLAEQVKAGTRAPPDLFRQQAQTKFDETAVIDAANRVRADETQLLRRLREDPMQPHLIAEPAADTTPVSGVARQLSNLLSLSLSSRPDLQASRQRVDADVFEIHTAEGGRLPKIAFGVDLIGAGRVYGRDVIGGVDQLTIGQRPLGSQLGQQLFAVASLGISWDIFDRRRTGFDIERATAVAFRDRLSAEDLQLQIVGEVQRAIDDYDAASERLVASAAALRAAEEAFAAVQGRYDAGLATFVDVLSAQSALTQARALREQSVTGFALQKAVIQYVTGAPVP